MKKEVLKELAHQEKIFLKKIVQSKIPYIAKRVASHSLEWLAGATIINTFPYTVSLYKSETDLGEKISKISNDQVDKMDALECPASNYYTIGIGIISGGIIGAGLQGWGYYELATEVSPWLLGIPLITNTASLIYSKYVKAKSEVEKRGLLEVDKYKGKRLKDVK